MPLFNIAHINGVSIIREGSDPEEWRVSIDMEEDGTHSTVSLRLSRSNSVILRDALARKIGTK